mmetsp:Transcript_5770/g.4958  ORF Transcript_5770/g.4958 Transcript_5770/m.4958 type:complete len:164 (+) Transcript_5770:422-913(+)
MSKGGKLKKPKLYEAQSVFNRDLLGAQIAPEEKLAQTFLDRVAQLDAEEDKEFFMTQLDKINKEADNHFQSLSNSPIRKKMRRSEVEIQESGQAYGNISGTEMAEDLVLRLNEIKANNDEETPFKEASNLHTPKAQSYTNKNIDEEEEDSGYKEDEIAIAERR